MAVNDKLHRKIKVEKLIPGEITYLRQKKATNVVFQSHICGFLMFSNSSKRFQTDLVKLGNVLYFC